MKAGRQGGETRARLVDRTWQESGVDWRAQQQAAGYSDLTQVPAEKVQDVTALVHLYRRAIEAGTGAEVCERYRSFDSTNAGNKNAEELTPTIDDYRRDLRWAVRDFLGRTRITVELI